MDTLNTICGFESAFRMVESKVWFVSLLVALELASTNSALAELSVLTKSASLSLLLPKPYVFKFDQSSSDPFNFTFKAYDKFDSLLRINAPPSCTVKPFLVTYKPP